MIKASASPSLDGLAARLAAKALALAKARATRRALAQRDDPARWRRAGLIWPLFAKD
jgi:hypothetical protein